MGKHRKPQKAKEPSASSNQTEKSNAPKHASDAKPDWHAVKLPVISVPSKLVAPSPRLIENLHQHANALLDAEASEYAKKTASSSTHAFQNKMISDGTWEDKVSVLTLMVQESPLHTFKHFESLLGMAKKKSRDQALLALNAVKDMLGQGTILPSDRGLRAFGKQPQLHAALQGVSPQWTADKPLPKSLSNTHLVHWAYEDRLKKGYFELLRILEGWCGDEIEFSRIRAMTYAWELLKDKPEQEENLLRLVVNKLGDRSKKVASKASFLLLELQRFHPAMKPEIIKSIKEDILLRSNQTLGAKYYAIITLNQTVLQTSAPEVANALLDVYFSLFTTVLNQMNQKRVDQKPAENAKKRKRKGGKLQVASEKPDQEMTDRVNAQILTGINRAFPYSSKDSEKLEQHVDTMFRIAHSSNFNTSVQALLLIQQISSIHHISSDRFMRTLYESLLDPRLLKSSKQTVYLNLLYRSLKVDASVRRVKAFVKRLLQVLTLHEPPFICGALYLIADLTNLFPSLRTLVEQPEFQQDDEEEHFHDADIEPPVPSNSTTSPSNVSTGYDPRKRDPLHANADYAPLWELPTLAAHYHPSIPLFAQHLLNPSTVKCPTKPDPSSHTLSHFLDRFVYRNPKTRADAQTRGTSLMQPALASNNATDVLITKAGGRGTDTASLNTEAFWNRRAEDVKPEEVFFHRYFEDLHANRKKKPKKQAKSKSAGDSDEDDEKYIDDAGFDELDEDEDEIWRALTSSRPELEGGSDIEDESDGADDDELEAAMQSGSDFDDDDLDAADLSNDDYDGDDSDSKITGPTLDDLISSNASAPSLIASKPTPNAKSKNANAKSKTTTQTRETEETAVALDNDNDEDDDNDNDEDDDDDPFQISDSSAVWSSDDSEVDVDASLTQPATTSKKSLTGKGSRDKGTGKSNSKNTNNDNEGPAKKKRRRIRDLPTFASVEEYAGLLGSDGEE